MNLLIIKEIGGIHHLLCSHDYDKVVKCVMQKYTLTHQRVGNYQSTQGDSELQFS